MKFSKKIELKTEKGQAQLLPAPLHTAIIPKQQKLIVTHENENEMSSARES